MEGGGRRRFCGKTCRVLPENVRTFRGKHPDFCAKLAELIRQAGQKRLFLHKRVRFSCRIFFRKPRSGPSERHEERPIASLQTSESLIQKTKERKSCILKATSYSPNASPCVFPHPVSLRPETAHSHRAGMRILSECHKIYNCPQTTFIGAYRIRPIASA